MIKYYNRKTKDYEIEKVAGEKYLNWIYSSPVGLTLLEMLVKKKLFSYIYGKHCDTKKSKNKIESFVKELQIDMSMSEKGINEFTSFNDFFIRRLKPEARPINTDSSVFISPADGRLTAYNNISIDKLIQVKGLTYSLKELIGNDTLAEKYEGGQCLIFRLCPVDYHRLHFVDNGICDETVRISGLYYSVNPVALEKKEKLFCQNKREWSLFHSDNFKDILHVEVGATCVGTIIQTYNPGERVNKGDEKGYFKFGGSTTILFLEKDAVELDKDIIEQSALGHETKVNMGERIGIRKA